VRHGDVAHEKGEGEGRRESGRRKKGTLLEIEAKPESRTCE